MAITLKDVAKLAGVSASTVSRVLSNDIRISAKTKEQVLKCVKELDYRVNSIARSLKTNKSFTVGFICPEIPNEFFMSIAKGAEDELRNYGYNMIICNSNENTIEETDRIKLLLEKRVDGIILIPTSGEGAHIENAIGDSIPYVLCDRLVKGLDANAVLVDNISGAYSAVEYLIKNGFKKIGFIGGDMELTSAKERFDGYKKALSDNKIDYDEKLVKLGDFHAKSGYKLTEELMNGNVESIFISNYYMHIGATKYLIENRDLINKQIILASFDDMELSSLFEFCKVRVQQPMTEIGKMASKILIRNIEEKTKEDIQILRLKTNLIV